MPKWRKILIWLMRGAAALMALFLLCMACLYVFLQQSAGQLISSYLDDVSSKTGLSFDIGSVDVTLLPLPAFAISDARVKGPGLNISIAWAQARPTISSILNADLFPGYIRVLRPDMACKTDLPLSSPTKIIEHLQKIFPAQSGAALPLPYSIEVEIAQGGIKITSSKDGDAQFSNMEADITLYADGDINGQVAFSAFRLFSHKNVVASLENFNISGRSNIYHFSTDTQNLQAKGLASAKGIARDVAFAINFDSAASGWHGRLNIDGHLEFEKELLPIALAGGFSHAAKGHDTVFKGLAWQIGDDSGHMELNLATPPKLADFSINGKLYANRLSLTQWLGFARNLAPGLQLALDNITDAKMDFSIDAKGMKATNIKASSCGATFTGAGGVPDWKKPVVSLNLKSPLANLGLGLPESVGKTPDKPYFPHPALTPMPGTPLKPGETGIGYDIRLGAKIVRYGPLRIRNANLRIHPGKMDKSGLEDVLLDATGSLYGGHVRGNCILGADKSLPIYITARAEKVNGAAISKDMPVLPFRQGLWQGNATVTSQGKTLAKFLANLKGNLTATGANARFAATDAKMVFKQASAKAHLRSASWNGRHLTMDGKWSGSVKDETLSGQSDVNGKLLFGEDGLTFRQLPGTINATAYFLPGDGKVKITGKFSAQSSKNTFELAGGKLDILGITAYGDARLDGSKAQISGKFRADIARPKQLLERAGIKNASVPKALSPVKISANFTTARDMVKLANIQAILGKSKATGSLECNLKNKKPDLNVDLTLDKLHLTDFLHEGKSNAPWDFHFLTTFNAKGQLGVKELSGFDAKFQNFRAPFNLENGQILANGITSQFYGSTMTGSFDGDFHNGLVFDSLIRANSFDLGAAAKAQKMEARLTGSASVEMRLKARLTGHAKVAPNLDGKWFFNVRNGSFQGMEKGKPGRLTQFNVAQASGEINSGIVKSGDFKLTGPGLSVTGKGDLNLPKQTIDCDFYVSMKGLPDFPLWLHGPLNNMQTSIGAGKLILNAVGDVTGGFVNAIGGLLKGAWGIFTK